MSVFQEQSLLLYGILALLIIITLVVLFPNNKKEIGKGIAVILTGAIVIGVFYISSTSANAETTNIPHSTYSQDNTRAPSSDADLYDSDKMWKDLMK